MSRLVRRMLILGLAAACVGFTDSDLGDPTRPARVVREGELAAPAEPSKLVLRSVVVSEWDRVAEINDRRVRIGDQVAGHWVLDIDIAGVLLDGPEGELLITLSGSGFKKPALADRSSQ